MLGGEGLNVSFMVGLAFAVAASANFPALLLSLTWRRFNTTGAVVGVLFGVISSIALVVISPTVWPGPDSEGGALSWYSLANPGIISIPLGFIGCFLGTMLARERTAEAKFDELKVRSETGLGAEAADGHDAHGRRHRPAARRGGGDGHDGSPLVVPSGTTWPTGTTRGSVMEGTTKASADQIEQELEQLLDQELFEPPAEFREHALI